jgi:hypothetical protein
MGGQFGRLTPIGVLKKVVAVMMVAILIRVFLVVAAVPVIFLRVLRVLANVLVSFRHMVGVLLIRDMVLVKSILIKDFLVVVLVGAALSVLAIFRHVLRLVVVLAIQAMNGVVVHRGQVTFLGAPNVRRTLTMVLAKDLLGIFLFGPSDPIRGFRPSRVSRFRQLIRRLVQFGRRFLRRFQKGK